MKLLGVLAAATVAVAACGPEPTTPQQPLADFIAANEGTVGTGAIFPQLPGAPDLLGTGWLVEDGVSDLAVVGRRAHLRVFIAGDADASLDFEARLAQSYAAENQARLVLRVNRKVVQIVRLGKEWQRFTVAIPTRFLDLGWNNVRMTFPDVEPENEAAAVVARFRELRLRSTQRSVWPERPATVRSGTAVAGGTFLEMPTDSVLEAVVETALGLRFSGSVEAERIGESDAAIRAAIEVLGDDGTWSTAFQTSFDSQSVVPVPFDVELEPASAEDFVALRVRVNGQANGYVRWLDAGFLGSAVKSLRAPGGLLAPPSTARLGQPDVILILLDAARADAFDGDGEPATPHIAALADAGTAFSNARAPSSWTGQTVPSLLTGRHPGAIGAELWGSRIPEQVPTLAELLSEFGYSTSVWSQHTVYRGNSTFRRGFDHVTSVPIETPEERAVTPSAEELYVDARPAFALIHLVPPHGPYVPPEPFFGSRTDWYNGNFRANARVLSQFPRRRSPEDLSADDRRYVRARYDENVAFADHLVGQIVDTIRSAGRYEQSLIVVLSDHGEAFLEHDFFLHGDLLYEEFVRVPLVIKWPAGSGGYVPREDMPVSLIDIVPTLVDGLGLADEPFEFQGRSLLPLVFNDDRRPQTSYAYTRGVASAAALPRRVRAYWQGRYKLIAYETTGRFELFDLLADPGETVDLAGAEPLRARYLLQQLRFNQRANAAYLLLTAGGQVDIEELDEETARRLRALGYLR